MQEFTFSPDDNAIARRIGQMPIFDAMDDAMLRHLLAMACFRRYASGETIITEGATDQQVYFLVQGRCVVNRDGTEVATIDTVGDVFGEMGMVDKQPRSATITTVSETLCMVLDGTFLAKVKQADQLAAKALFYRVFSEIMAARIRDANARLITLESELQSLSVERPLL